MIIKRKSIISGKLRMRDIPVNPDDMIAWEAGLGNIQDLMPYLNDNDREFILSGITQGEWDTLFVKEQESEDDGAAF
jgi:hypothetical protein